MTASSCEIDIDVRSSPLGGMGVFTYGSLSRGQRISYFQGYEINQDTYRSLSLDGKRIEPTGRLGYLNHSCAPNAHFEGRWLSASRDIAPGEELTIDYLATEAMLFNHFDCKCGAPNCRGRI
jgi:hypothetical protein